ncbi:MAG: DNA-directed RNA polymerase subunit omega [Clostridia bacterium]|nr:DNA-directed RNA polymerase subunit omega [Clostridia bacterium]
MLVDPPNEKLLEKVSCSYELAVLVAQRARALVDGAQPLVDKKAANFVSLACQEVAADKVVSVAGDHKDEMFVPITRERREREAQARRKKEEEAQQQYEKLLNEEFVPVSESFDEDSSDAVATQINSLFEEIDENDIDTSADSIDDDEEV